MTLCDATIHLGILARAGAGKTSHTERLLYAVESPDCQQRKVSKPAPAPEPGTTFDPVSRISRCFLDVLGLTQCGVRSPRLPTTHLTVPIRAAPKLPASPWRRSRTALAQLSRSPSTSSSPPARRKGLALSAACSASEACGGSPSRIRVMPTCARTSRASGWKHRAFQSTTAEFTRGWWDCWTAGAIVRQANRATDLAMCSTCCDWNTVSRAVGSQPSGVGCASGTTHSSSCCILIPRDASVSKTVRACESTAGPSCAQAARGRAVMPY